MREALPWAPTQARECEEQAALEVFPAVWASHCCHWPQL